ncbi:SCP2 sterol-binding domain-containing protein [Halomonas sp. ANAO-440]|uniref:ubiquinone biosynthesis accessory factor UbiJ n=1 Tax=Halomonas sp. ANAO-440 TaxID=2861360 RepID=UPI001CAA4470|nr:SCP2 sterol-binding domain-containing protein [Halomonas sp. ANAO-440]MBZ0330160.1 SCP2 sterol-binding domain-containing protein [Halomonas sp. ANAO-440]
MTLTPTLLLAGIERTLNALLAQDPAAPSRLARLSGNRLLLRLERPDLSLAIHFHPAGLDLLRPEAQDEDAIDAVVTLNAETLGKLLGGESIERLMFQGKLSVRGQVHLLEATRDLLLDLDLDWEGEMARWLGDVPAHGLAEGLRRATRWGRRARGEMRNDIAEYVFEEAKLLPGKYQLENLRDHLTELEMTTDRLEARLARLHRQLDREAAL